ncbi:MAG: NAD-dependent deacylase [Alphaproteobacteria bacterium]|nr:NAD-dependent deacylase [Alphaproteobacteria bacterium]
MTRIYKNIVILSGAGISAESGLATFRSENGLWNHHRVEDVATVEGFMRNPEYVHEFYNEMRPELFEAQPNPAHFAITELQQNYPYEVSVITQNVDTLHEKAGNKNVYHIHGQINQIVCFHCGKVFETWGDVHSDDKCENCGARGFLKPNIVFFGENLLYMDKVDRLLKNCDLFISVGTSGVVYPAAGFVQIAKFSGAETCEINMEKTSNNSLFDRHIYGKAGTALPELVKQLLGKIS